MTYILAYKNNPTVAGTDGTQVTEGDGTQAISVTLNATNNEESAPIKIALRYDTGYQASGDITIAITGKLLPSGHIYLSNTN